MWEEKKKNRYNPYQNPNNIFCRIRKIHLKISGIPVTIFKKKKKEEEEEQRNFTPLSLILGVGGVGELRP